MGRHSTKKARKVRIVKRKPVVSLPWRAKTRGGAEYRYQVVEAAPFKWELVDEETGITFKDFDSFKAAKNYCIRHDYDFGQFERAKRWAKTARVMPA